MVSNTREIALEQAIQKHLTGHTTEELACQPAPLGSAPYRIGQPVDFDARYALDTRLFWQFLKPPKAANWPSCATATPAIGRPRSLNASTG